MKRSILTLSLFLFVSVPQFLYAQSNTPPLKTFNVGASIGGSTIGFPMVTTGISYQNNQHIFSLRYVSASEAIEGLALYSHAEPFERISALDFLYGLENKLTRKIYGSFGGGVSYLHGVKRGKYLKIESGIFGDNKVHEKIEFKTAGIVADAKIAFKPNKYFNISLNGFGNLNPQKSYAGISLGLNINFPL